MGHCLCRFRPRGAVDMVGVETVLPNDAHVFYPLKVLGFVAGLHLDCCAFEGLGLSDVAASS